MQASKQLSATPFPMRCDRMEGSLLITSLKRMKAEADTAGSRAGMLEKSLSSSCEKSFSRSTLDCALCCRK